MISPDKFEYIARQEQLLLPRPGIKIAVTRRFLRVPLDEVGYISSKQGFWQDFVYVEGVSVPVFTAIRSSWELTEEDDRTKQSARDFLINAELSLLPDSTREPIELFRAERLSGINPSKRTRNLDEARIEGEKLIIAPDPRTSFYLLTPRYHSEQRPISK